MTTDAAIVEKWFTVLADRYGREIERITVKLYLDAFDRAKVTDRGLEIACREIFEQSRFLPEPEAFIIRARDAERRIRDESMPKLPRMDPAAQDAATFQAEYDARRADARAWAMAHPEEWRGIRESVGFAYAQRYPKGLTGLQQEMMAAEMMAACLRAREHGVVQTCALPADWSARKPDPFTPLSDVTAAALSLMTP